MIGDRNDNVLAIRRSALFAICVQLYQQHTADGSGACARCGGPLADCIPRRNSARVLTAAGLDPAKFDAAEAFGGGR